MLSKFKVENVWRVGLQEGIVMLWIEVHAFYFNIIERNSYPSI